jgi:RNA polymerase sigma factor (sigma-70 family)
VRRHSAAAVRLASVICASSADAEDAAQEAFLKMFFALNTFRRDGPILPWLLRIVANEAKNHNRSAGRRSSLVARAAALGPATMPSPEDFVVAETDADAVLAAMATLDERDRLVIGYRYFAGLSEREMAEAMGCRQGTVKSRLARSLAKLRPVLAGKGVTVAYD